MCLLPGPKSLVIGYHHHYSRSLGVNTAAHTLHGYSGVRGKESIVTQWFELLIGHHHATSDPPPAPSPHPWRGRYAPPCKAGHNLRVVPPDQLGQVQADFARRLGLANVACSSLGTEAMEEAVRAAANEAVAPQVVVVAVVVVGGAVATAAAVIGGGLQ